MLSPQIETRLYSPDVKIAAFHMMNISSIVDMCRQWDKSKGGLFAGYTYWGQFIAHEMGPRPGLVDTRSAVMELDSLYGDGWNSKDIAVDDQTGEFKLGKINTSSTGSGPKYDLYRNKHGIPHIPEIRNDENLILSQFHVLMQRFHNALARTLKRFDKNKNGELIFNESREALLTAFHHIVINDFLKVLCTPTVYDHLITNGNNYFKFSSKLPLPVEIKHATMRYGHSQVRENYHLNTSLKDAVNLGVLFDLTSSGSITTANSLPADHFVSWEHFFPLSRRTQGANMLDPHITEAMQKIPAPGGKTFNVIELNLMAGINSAIATGQVVSNKLLQSFPELANIGIVSELDEYESSFKSYALDQLSNNGIREHTPLWVYILIDALLHKNGITLGPLGSFFLCETLKNSIENSKNKNQLPEFAKVRDSTNLYIVSMADLITFTENNEKELQQ